MGKSQCKSSQSTFLGTGKRRQTFGAASMDLPWAKLAWPAWLTFGVKTGFVDKQRAVGCLLPRILHVVLAPPAEDTDQLNQIQRMATKIVRDWSTCWGRGSCDCSAWERDSFQGASKHLLNTCKKVIQKTKPASSQCWQDERQQTQVQTGEVQPEIGRNIFLWRQSSIGTGCLKHPCHLQPWMFSRPV